MTRVWWPLIFKGRAYVKWNTGFLLRLLPLIAFIPPLVWLFLLDPASLDVMWKGRAFQLFFVWLISLESILNWKSLQPTKINKLVSLRSGFLFAALILPTVFVAVYNSFGLNSAMADWARQSGAYWWRDVPVAAEYLVFAALFCLLTFLLWGSNGLKIFLIPILFSALIGTIFIIDSIYPYGQFTPFQFLVPTTTTLASNILSFMGYSTKLDFSQANMPRLTVIDPNDVSRTATLAVAWPCAGIESLLIFSVMTLLFLKNMAIPWKTKVSYFAFGAVITYFVNILRVVSIYLVAVDGGNVEFFHSTYGPLYPIVWIMFYPLIIMGSRNLWGRLKNKRHEEKPDAASGHGEPAWFRKMNNSRSFPWPVLASSRRREKVHQKWSG